MLKNITILIYEKDKYLNSILYKLISDVIEYETYAVNDEFHLLELVNEKKFDYCILNIEDINPISKKFFDNLLNKNHHIDIVGYCNNLVNNSTFNNLNIIVLEKPFRFRTLLKKLEYLQFTRNKRNKIILIKHIEFLPNKKTLFNSKTKITIHLTEKENHLLHYLYDNRNEELTKNDLLINIWGIKKEINTHTLETHIYRLKQKLFKLEPDLSFSLINNNGLYSIKYN